MSKRLVFWNSASGVLLLAADAVLAFVMTPIIVQALGNRDYGLWEILLGIVGYLGVLEVSVGPGIVRYIAVAHGRGDTEEMHRVFATGVVVMTCAGVLGAALMSGLGLWGEAILGLQTGDFPAVELLFLGFGLNLLAAFAMGAFSCFLMGLQQHWFINVTRSVCAVLQAGGVLWVLLSGKTPPLLWMVGLLIGVALLQLVVFAGRAAALGGRLRWPGLGFELATARSLFGFGLKSGLLMAATTLVRRAALIVTAQVVGVASVVFFVIPNRLSEYAQSLGMALGFPLTPYFAAVSGKGGMDATRDVWIPTTRVLQFFTLGVPIGVALLGGPFIALWMGEEYSRVGEPLLWWLCFGLLAQGVACNCNRVLVSQAAHGRAAAITAGASIAAVALSIPLAHRFGLMGVAGAVAGFLVTQAVIELTLACKLVGLRPSRYLQLTALRFAAPALALACILTGLRAAVEPDSYWSLIGQAAAGGLVYTAAVLFFAMSAEERAAARKFIRARLSFGALRPASPD